MHRLLLLLAAAVLASAEADTSLVKVHVGPIDTGKSPYVYVPFEVPQGASEVVVELDYDRAENTVDFSIFDSRFSGRDNDLTGYRGKNPNRQPLISRVGAKSASDGHIAGPLPAGKWQVMLYVYRTVPAGVDVSLHITVVTAGSKTRTVEGPRWWRGDLHVHTLHSDGSWLVSTLSAAAKQAGLDFLAITDHNVVSHHADIDAMPPGGPLLIRGIELTTAGGHMNIWGVPPGEIFEHRQQRGDNAAIASLVSRAHQRGARISVNHPFAICPACDWSFDKNVPGFDSIEVWNGAWAEEDDKAIAMWDGLLRSGRRITAVGSSDSHGRNGPVGSPTVHVFAASRETKALLDAIGQGRVVISGSPAWNVSLEISSGKSKAGPGEELEAASGAKLNVAMSFDGNIAGTAILYSDRGEAGRWPVSGGRFRQTIDVTAAQGFYRLEIRRDGGNMAALTNPVWVRPPR